MRILVLSDSHGDAASCRLAAQKHPEAEVIIHLGDGEEDINISDGLWEGKNIFRVRGNSYRSDILGFPESLNLRLGGRKVYISHGYRENVKFGIGGILKRAGETGAEIALYGHTHVPHKSYENGIYIMNPGSIRQSSYGCADITEAGIVLLLMKL